jgi:membrane-associated protease RseP (regulator of RpoE activity)
MRPQTRTILIATTTFIVGALAGATLTFGALRDGTLTEPPETLADLAEQAEPPTIAAITETEQAQVPEEDVSADAVEPSATDASPEDAAPDLIARVDELTAGWGRMQAELAELRARLVRVEREEASAGGPATGEQPQRSSTPEEQRDALLRAGVLPEVAEDIVWRRAQVSLAQLELRDEAARDGWIGTARFREEMQRINEERVSIEDEIGADAYDRYLFETGQTNRVAVESVLPGSAADENGLMPGDVIERYGETKVMDFADLRSATRTGERDELVPVSVLRDGRRLEMWLPRGPIGIGLDAARVDPNS